MNACKIERKLAQRGLDALHQTVTAFYRKAIINSSSIGEPLGLPFYGKPLKKPAIHKAKGKINDMAKSLKHEAVASKQVQIEVPVSTELKTRIATVVTNLGIESRNERNLKSLEDEQQFLLLQAARRSRPYRDTTLYTQLARNRRRISKTRSLMEQKTPGPRSKSINIGTGGHDLLHTESAIIAPQKTEEKTASMVHDRPTDKLLKSYLPKFAKLAKAEDLEPYPTELTEDELALERTVKNSMARIQRREHKP